MGGFVGLPQHGFFIIRPADAYTTYHYLIQYQHCPEGLRADYVNAAIHHLDAAGLSQHAAALLQQTSIYSDQNAPPTRQLRLKVDQGGRAPVDVPGRKESGSATSKK